MSGKRVAIIGGGITGLTAAYGLEQHTDCSVALYESSDRLGGKIETIRSDSFLIEQGPDCFFSRKPAGFQLARMLGLTERLLEPQAKHFSLLHGGVLHEVPRELVSFIGVPDEAIEAATFLSESGKARARAERDQPVRDGADESIRSFFSRRFGSEFSALVSEPLLAGTHGGDPDILSMRALYPSYLSAERKYGSLFAAAVRDPGVGPTFLSFDGGMETFVSTLGERLIRTEIHLGHRVKALEEIEADHYIVAIPSNSAAFLFHESAPEAAALLADIPYATSTILTLAVPGDQMVKDSTGFLVPPSEQDLVAGATWSSSKWAGRAPEGTTLIRVFLRNREALSDEELVARATEKIRAYVGWKGDPIFSRVKHWDKALPQYVVGHLDRLEAIERALDPLGNVQLAGTSYRGVGIPDCIDQGGKAVSRFLEEFAG